jgi:hypothetical protein
MAAETAKAVTEGKVSEQTVEAVAMLADINTLQAAIKTMGEAFREERESLTRRLERVEEDLAHTRRELVDMYRRDQYYAQAINVRQRWLAENFPRIRVALPDVGDPPPIEPLAPLHIPDEETLLPRRRWYDSEEKTDGGLQQAEPGGG